MDAASDISLDHSRFQEGAHIFRSLKKFLEYVWHFVQRIFLTDVFYPIEGQIISLATGIIFTRSMRTNQPICLKVWRPCNNELYNTEDETMCMNYLIEGLEFNRRFAKGVYLGIAPVEKLSKDRIQRGRLIENPEKSKPLKPGVQYALVMKRLDENWRLDHQLRQGELGTKKSIEFLAREVARMHGQLAPSKDIAMGTPDCILSKLALNMQLFDKALSQLTSKDVNVKECRSINKLMENVCKEYTSYFKKRYESECIKRCHGDLKATNLWIRPQKTFFFGLIRYSQQFLALDCVDFNHPEFCHIDTLSDVAMLAIDIEVCLMDRSDSSGDRLLGNRLARHFLRTYLREVGETSEIVWPLLGYYMTEKAMICAYMCILYDGLETLGEKYLDVALAHAKKLDKRQVPSKKFSALKKQRTSMMTSHSN